MEKRSAYRLIYTGLVVRHLQNINTSFTVQRTIKLLNSLNEHISESGFQVSLSGFNQFLGPIQEGLILKPDNDLIDESTRDDIISKSKTLENMLFSEAVIKHIYVVPQRRYNGDFLANFPMKILKKGVFERIPEMAAFDFSASCRCLLYGEGTACAFHILRATEEVLKHYYYKYKKTKRLKKPMWGPMISELRSKKTNKPPDNILNTLDLIRTNYRNPTQHPESKYDIENAQDLFGICIDIINKMGIELDKR